MAHGPRFGFPSFQGTRTVTELVPRQRLARSAARCPRRGRCGGARRRRPAAARRVRAAGPPEEGSLTPWRCSSTTRRSSSGSHRSSAVCSSSTGFGMVRRRPSWSLSTRRSNASCGRASERRHSLRCRALPHGGVPSACSASIRRPIAQRPRRCSGD